MVSDVQWCGRCGAVPRTDELTCLWCEDGIADEARAGELLAAYSETSDRAYLRAIGRIRDRRAVPVMAEALSSDDWRLVEASAKALGQCGDTSAVPPLARCLEHPMPFVQVEACVSLGKLGGTVAADALAGVVDRVRVAASALAWLGDERVVPHLWALLVEEWEHPPGNTYLGIGRCSAGLGSLAKPALLAAVDRLESRVVDAHGREWAWARDVLSGLSIVDADAHAEIVQRWSTRSDGLGVISPKAPMTAPMAAEAATTTAPSEPGGGVKRWSFTSELTDTRTEQLVSKMGGQPVWRDSPTWPLHPVSGTPMPFLLQFAVPREICGDGTWMAYVFLDPPELIDAGSPTGIGAMLIQPGREWPAGTLDAATGPTTWWEEQIVDILRPETRRSNLDRQMHLREGIDDVGRSEEDGTDDRLWNKIGGIPRFLQSEMWPPGDGWRILFQLSPRLHGFELADAAECYGFIHPEGKGWFQLQSH